MTNSQSELVIIKKFPTSLNGIILIIHTAESKNQKVIHNYNVLTKKLRISF